ncbi:hypothetical protein M409DRAFT_67961 [Zasmidium cellare ATCC 36951]|uniref:Uncharacterized protein n=1 Tax=Zasmidium cellare ATCC 36951 TaxID=1080233 RepID=A0A6A6CE73_ZASCE|nr:uncharacterized protein M409DRAFT_67961 [Zasmidium cellare ATCC 36951]KAF2164468.1 hypothetical protein M409DRAFT_67961 [Zasmidium cellare ATCC 36951]
MAGKGAQRRNNVKKAKIKQEAKKQAKRHQQFLATMPKITEEDLLNFQITHFGDDTRPERWFVPAEEALNFEPPEPDDDLGYYDDGVKRTLTDEQIAIFKRSELWQIQREQQREKEEETEQREFEEGVIKRAASPASESSLEDELLAYANIQRKQKSPSPPPQDSKLSLLVTQESNAQESNPRKSNPRKPSTERSGSEASTVSKNRKRSEEVPYDQRHKRKWEAYIEEVDPNEGSLTHRRLVRELDNQQTESIEMDY